MALPYFLRAFRARDYTLFYFGQGISLFGTWTQQVATGWLLFRLTHSEALLGAHVFTSQLPGLLFTPWFGVLADRLDRRTVIFITQLLSMAQALLLAALFFSGHIQVWHLFALGGLLGIINAMDIPFRQSFMLDLVGNRERLTNAIALNSLMFHGARLVGPVLAGVILARSGEGLCFSVNALSYLPVVGALSLLRVRPHLAPPTQVAIVSQLKEGFLEVSRHVPIRTLLILIAVVNLVAMPYVSLLPAFAGKTLSGGASLYGTLVSFSGLGSMVGALVLTLNPSLHRVPLLLRSGVFVLAAGLMGLSFATAAHWAMPCLVAIGLGMMLCMVSVNTLVQTLSPPAYRGRFQSFLVMANMGMAPLGALGMGALAQVIGVGRCYRVGGLLTLVAAAVFYFQISKVVRALKG